MRKTYINLASPDYDEELALKKEKDDASKERLAKLRDDLKEREAKLSDLDARWQAERASEHSRLTKHITHNRTGDSAFVGSRTGKHIVAVANQQRSLHDLVFAELSNHFAEGERIEVARRVQARVVALRLAKYFSRVVQRLLVR